MTGSCPHQVEASATTQPCILEFPVHVLVLPARVIGRRLASLTLSSGVQCWGFHQYSRSIPGDTWLPPQWEHMINMSLLLPVSSSTAEIRQGGSVILLTPILLNRILSSVGVWGWRMLSWGWGLRQYKRTLCLSGGTRGHNHDYPFPWGSRGQGYWWAMQNARSPSSTASLPQLARRKGFHYLREYYVTLWIAN